MKDHKNELWQYNRDFIALGQSEQDYFLYGRLIAIRIKPGEKLDSYGRVNKKDIFDYKLFDK